MKNDMFRILSSFNEVLTTLQKAKSNDPEINLLQKFENNKPNIIKGKIISVDDQNRKLMIFIKSLDGEINTKEKVTIYYQSKNISFLFKAKPNKKSGNHLIFNFPEEIRVHENRKHPRFFFDFHHLPVVTIIEITKKGTSEKKINVYLHDISNAGMGLLVNQTQYYLFQSLSEVQILKIGRVVFGGQFLGNIIYVINSKKKFGDNNQPLYKVGIQFSNPLDINKLLCDFT